MESAAVSVDTSSVAMLIFPFANCWRQYLQLVFVFAVVNLQTDTPDHLMK